MFSNSALTIVAISGSLRSGSGNTRLLQAIAHELPAGVSMTFWSGIGDVPYFNEDDEAAGTPEAVAALSDAIRGADALLISTPEYNTGMPGMLKNAVDWASRPRGSAPLQGKPVGTVSASPLPYGAAWALESLRKTLGVSGADVTDTELSVPKVFEQFDEDGRLADAELREKAKAIITELIERATPDETGEQEPAGKAA